MPCDTSMFFNNISFRQTSFCLTQGWYLFQTKCFGLYIGSFSITLIGLLLLANNSKNPGSRGRVFNMLAKNMDRIQELRERLSSTPLGTFIEHAIHGLQLVAGSTLYRHTRSVEAGALLRLTSTNYDFILHLYDLLSPWCSDNEPKLRKGSKSYEFKTYYHALFENFYQMWYVNGVRTIPEFVYNNFSIVMLAYWAMCASTIKGNQFRQSCGMYTAAERERLALAITTKLGLEAKVVSTWIVINDQKKVCELLYPYFHPSQYYRLENSK